MDTSDAVALIQDLKTPSWETGFEVVVQNEADFSEEQLIMFVADRSPVQQGRSPGRPKNNSHFAPVSDYEEQISLTTVMNRARNRMHAARRISNISQLDRKCI
eukprot:EC118103.1.p1 GENE.EC118103.1~~EC118103.1.p1  ORF type:complete len:103 (-),score=1.44 EC118103.1:108-416(-)